MASDAHPANLTVNARLKTLATPVSQVTPLTPGFKTASSALPQQILSTSDASNAAPKSVELHSYAQNV
jgi:hypothetical protein